MTHKLKLNMIENFQQSADHCTYLNMSVDQSSSHWNTHLIEVKFKLGVRSEKKSHITPTFEKKKQ